MIEQYPRCCYCASLRPTAERDHMPPKCLFDTDFRPNEMVVPACKQCNRGTATADLLAALVARWGDNSDIAIRRHNELGAQLRAQAPEIADELTAEFGPNLDRQGRLHLLQYGTPMPLDASIVTVGPRAIRQLNLFAHKATLAFYFCHFGKPLSSSGVYWTQWRTKEDYWKGVPRFLLDMLPRYGTLVQGRRSTREDFEYHFDSNDAEGLFAYLARFRSGLFVTGFVVSDGAQLPPTENGWTKGGDLLALVPTPEFALRD